MDVPSQSDVQPVSVRHPSGWKPNPQGPYHHIQEALKPCVERNVSSQNTLGGINIYGRGSPTTLTET